MVEMLQQAVDALLELRHCLARSIHTESLWTRCRLELKQPLWLKSLGHNALSGWSAMQMTSITAPAELLTLEGSSVTEQKAATAWQAAKDSDEWSESTCDDDCEIDAPSDSEPESEAGQDHNGIIVTGMPDMCLLTGMSDIGITVTGMPDACITTGMSDVSITVTGMPDMCFTTGMSDMCITVTGMSDADECHYWPMEGSDSAEDWLMSTKRQLQRHMYWWQSTSVGDYWDSTLYRCSDVETYFFLGKQLRTNSAVDRGRDNRVSEGHESLAHEWDALPEVVVADPVVLSGPQVLPRPEVVFSDIAHSSHMCASEVSQPISLHWVPSESEDVIMLNTAKSYHLMILWGRLQQHPGCHFQEHLLLDAYGRSIGTVLPHPALSTP
eukprot:6487024-Amphidinium_carterae.1